MSTRSNLFLVYQNQGERTPKFAYKLHHYVQQHKLGMQDLFDDSTAEVWVHYMCMLYLFSIFRFLSSNVSTNYTALVGNMENLQKHQEPKNQILELCPFSKVDHDL